MGPSRLRNRPPAGADWAEEWSAVNRPTGYGYPTPRQASEEEAMAENNRLLKRILVTLEALLALAERDYEPEGEEQEPSTDLAGRRI